MSAEQKKDNVQMDESFRDSIATIDEKGKRVWMFPQQPSGRYYNLRTLFTFFYLAVFFTLPFIYVDGHPLFEFNVIERRFIFFGVIFWPQDFFIFVIGMLTFMVFIIVFTVAFGRVFCGWACPQTVFLEMVFRRIEYWIDGDFNQQKKLRKMAWTTEKIRKRVLKHSIYFLIAFLIANTFLAYIISYKELFRIIGEPLSMHFGGFVAILIFTGVFYGVFAWFREQACLIVCPYGRMQGVLLDKHSIVVAYDYVRGEPRGKFKKNEEKPRGDCVDCFHCVNVCPTGIDIRHGTQLECVNCTACIDACDHVMEKLDKPKGLIRYASESDIREGNRTRITPRKIGYSIVLTLLTGVLVTLLLTRSDMETTVLRAQGQIFQRQPDHRISNLYNLKLVNKTTNDIPVTLKLESHIGEIKLVGDPILLKAESNGEKGFFVILDSININQRKSNVLIGVYNGDVKIKTVKASFIAPESVTKH
jgi:cytochrome c oxidase accessory protein FixG